MSYNRKFSTETFLFLQEKFSPYNFRYFTIKRTARKSRKIFVPSFDWEYDMKKSIVQHSGGISGMHHYRYTFIIIPYCEYSMKKRLINCKKIRKAITLRIYKTKNYLILSLERSVPITVRSSPRSLQVSPIMIRPLAPSALQ